MRQVIYTECDADSRQSHAMQAWVMDQLRGYMQSMVHDVSVLEPATETREHLFYQACRILMLYRLPEGLCYETTFKTIWKTFWPDIEITSQDLSALYGTLERLSDHTPIFIAPLTDPTAFSQLQSDFYTLFSENIVTTLPTEGARDVAHKLKARSVKVKALYCLMNVPLMRQNETIETLVVKIVQRLSDTDPETYRRLLGTTYYEGMRIEAILCSLYIDRLIGRQSALSPVTPGTLRNEILLMIRQYMMPALPEAVTAAPLIYDVVLRYLSTHLSRVTGGLSAQDITQMGVPFLLYQVLCSETPLQLVNRMVYEFCQGNMTVEALIQRVWSWQVGLCVESTHIDQSADELLHPILISQYQHLSDHEFSLLLTELKAIIPTTHTPLEWDDSTYAYIDHIQQHELSIRRDRFVCNILYYVMKKDWDLAYFNSNLVSHPNRVKSVAYQFMEKLYPVMGCKANHIPHFPAIWALLQQAGFLPNKSRTTEAAYDWVPLLVLQILQHAEPMRLVREVVQRWQAALCESDAHSDKTLYALRETTARAVLIWSLGLTPYHTAVWDIQPISIQDVAKVLGRIVQSLDLVCAGKKVRTVYVLNELEHMLAPHEGRWDFVSPAYHLLLGIYSDLLAIQMDMQSTMSLDALCYLVCQHIVHYHELFSPEVDLLMMLLQDILSYLHQILQLTEYPLKQVQVLWNKKIILIKLRLFSKYTVLFTPYATDEQKSALRQWLCAEKTKQADPYYQLCEVLGVSVEWIQDHQYIDPELWNRNLEVQFFRLSLKTTLGYAAYDIHRCVRYFLFPDPRHPSVHLTKASASYMTWLQLLWHVKHAPFQAPAFPTESSRDLAELHEIHDVLQTFKLCHGLDLLDYQDLNNPVEYRYNSVERLTYELLCNPERKAIMQWVQQLLRSDRFYELEGISSSVFDPLRDAVPFAARLALSFVQHRVPLPTLTEAVIGILVVLVHTDYPLPIARLYEQLAEKSDSGPYVFLLQQWVWKMGCVRHKARAELPYADGAWESTVQLDQVFVTHCQVHLWSILHLSYQEARELAEKTRKTGRMMTQTRLEIEELSLNRAVSTASKPTGLWGSWFRSRTTNSQAAPHIDDSASEDYAR